MQPTIKIGGKAMIDETAYSSNERLKRLDIVLYKAPVSEQYRKIGIDENTKFIFRIIGLGSEKVEIKKGTI